MNTIGERIKYLRETKNLTQKQLSEFTNINRGNLSNYEKNRVLPASNTIISLSDFFNVSCDWILKGYNAEDINVSLNIKHNNQTNLIDCLTEDEKNLILNFRKLPERIQLKFQGRVEQAVDDLKDFQELGLSKDIKKQTSYNSGEEAITKEESA
ncbi:helix-turn-helix domain-containing protein [Vallitalea guaymasensis]|uniref:helix-turn-helix domain-containing protein n=1 Tax=Vallitalea guaymasensis TaxID=1185412 RepID=UPI000DE254C0|nr:helix-turn-helix domain-containing protein [Vallitalea guaymasensis]